MGTAEGVNQLNTKNISDFKVTTINPVDLDCDKNMARSWLKEDARLIGRPGQFATWMRDIKVGDQVLARCTKTGELGYRKVKNIFIAENVPTYLLYCQVPLEDSTDILTFETSADSIILVCDRGWVDIKNLKAGDQLEIFDRSTFSTSLEACEKTSTVEHKKITVFCVKATGMRRKMFSLELEDFHSYSVGGLELWLHDGMEYEMQEPISNTNHKPSQNFLRICGCSNMGGQQYVLDETNLPNELEYTYPAMKLISRCEQTGKRTVSKILHRLYHERIELCDLYYLHNGEQRCAGLSRAQELLVKNRGWVRAEQLIAGDMLESGDGNLTVVEYVQTEWGGEPDDSNFFAFILDGHNNFCLGWNGELCARGFRFDEA